MNKRSLLKLIPLCVLSGISMIAVAQVPGPGSIKKEITAAEKAVSNTVMQAAPEHNVAPTLTPAQQAAMQAAMAKAQADAAKVAADAKAAAEKLLKGIKVPH